MSSYASDQEVENVINASKRRCRIGKVHWKHLTRPYRPVNRWLSPSHDWWENPFRPTWSPLFGSANRKCSCPPGSACGNVACPYMPISTCNMNMMSVQ